LNIASEETWLVARLDLLGKGKALTRLRDDVVIAIQAMPWRPITNDSITRHIGAKDDDGKQYA
jgi:predicted dithiol-disulfide oxidoreductase (DUF899 family)